MKTETKIECKQILPNDGEAYIFKNFLTNAGEYFNALRKVIDWQHGTINIRGKIMQEARLTAFYGDHTGIQYKYSGKLNIAIPWTPELGGIKEFLKTSGIGEYNCCLLNFYRDGNDSIGAHSDDERELDKSLGIASISLGGTRDIVFKHKNTKQRIVLPMENGDLLLMKGETQTYWKHEVPTRATADPRINLTFRKAVENKPVNKGIVDTNAVVRQKLVSKNKYNQKNPYPSDDVK